MKRIFLSFGVFSLFCLFSCNISINTDEKEKKEEVFLEKNDIPVEKLQDSLQKMSILLDDYRYFDIKSNEEAQFFFEQNTISDPEQFVIDQLLATNVTKDENHPLIDYRPRRNAKFQINKIKLLNHRWVICDFSDGLDWGELLLRYDLNDDNSLSFKVFDQTLYVSEQKP
ncbi:MAG: hydrolase [Capnocytophaga sp.]|nr:hydrolase [Capnocytophaga sp.]